MTTSIFQTTFRLKLFSIIALVLTFDVSWAQGGSSADLISSVETANTAKDQQSDASGSNAGLGQAMQATSSLFVAAAAACTGPQAAACKAPKIQMATYFALQAAQAAMQAANQGGTSSDNGTAANNFQTFGADLNTTKVKNPTTQLNGSTNAPPPSGSGSSMASTKTIPVGAQEIIKKLNDMGYKVDLEKQTFTTPDGKSITASEAKSGSATEAKLGLSSGTVARGESLMQEILKRQNPNGGTANGALADADSAGGKAAALGDDGSSLGAAGADKNKLDGKNERAPASTLIAGLTSSYNGERIGVAAEDIFKMVTRRYQLKHEQDTFITLDRPGKGMFGRAATDK